MPNGTDPGVFQRRCRMASINGNTAKSVYSFTHFDAWAYGTNFFTISMFKSDHNDPTNPCTNAGVLLERLLRQLRRRYRILRPAPQHVRIGTRSSTPRPSATGPCITFRSKSVRDGETENNFLAPTKRDFVAGLQFAFDLPYKGFFNVAPLAYKEINHNAFDQCGLFWSGPIPGVNLHCGRKHGFQHDLGGRNQLLHGSRLPA